MSSDHWAELHDLFISALRRTPEDRAAFLREACHGNATLQAELESLLSSHDEDPRFLESPAFGSDIGEWIQQNLNEAITAAADAPRLPDSCPASVGRYRILRLVGEGGMGSVYEAEQEEPRRTVALKLVKAGLMSPELLWRFRQESQALARLQHPGIAQIYEAGTAKRGAVLQPFFAMEFIRGCPLLQYAHDQRLDARQLLELFRKICEAAHHAHQRGLIHRDLKPGNILVDESGQPKILDFGVVRVTDSDVEATRHTDMGQLIGTLAYMSPEQVVGDPLALDTRSDVYALGVILYQLLSGRLPYTISPKVHEAVRAIQEHDPTPLSSIDRNYRGDVETIVSRALEKDRTRRYASAADFSADILRFLRDEPIVARPASAIYQLWKFTRRHKSFVVAAAVVLLVLLLGIVVSTREAVLAKRAEQTAQAVNDFLRNDLLAQASVAHQSGPGVKLDPHLEVRTALDRAASQIERKFRAQPQVEAAIQDTIGQTYKDLGQYAEARKHLERALELNRQLLGPENPKTLNTMRSLGGTAQLQARYGDAENILNQTLGIQTRVLGVDNPDTLATMNNLAITYFFEGKYADAENLYRRALEVQRRVLGLEHPDTLASMNNLANTYVREGNYAKAEPLQTHTLEAKRRVLGPDHPDTLNSLNGLAVTLLNQGKYEQAGALQSEALGIKRRVLGPEHPDTLASMNNLGSFYYEQGRYAEAEALFSQTVEIKRRTLGPEHPDTLASINNLADVYCEQGKYGQAERLFGLTVDISRRKLGPENQYTLAFLSDMADMYQKEGKFGKAETLAEQILSSQRRIPGAPTPDLIDSVVRLALAYQSQGKFAESERLAREAVEFNRRYRAGDWQRFFGDSLLGAALAGQKKYGEAEPLLLAGFEGMAARKALIAVPNRVNLESTANWTRQLYQDWGKPEKAAAWKKTAAGERRSQFGRSRQFPAKPGAREGQIVLQGSQRKFHGDRSFFFGQSAKVAELDHRGELWIVRLKAIESLVERQNFNVCLVAFGSCHLTGIDGYFLV